MRDVRGGGAALTVGASPVHEVEEGGGGGQAALQDGLMARPVMCVKAAAIMIGVIGMTWAAPVP